MQADYAEPCCDFRFQHGQFTIQHVLCEPGVVGRVPGGGAAAAPRAATAFGAAPGPRPNPANNSELSSKLGLAAGGKLQSMQLI